MIEPVANTHTPPRLTGFALVVRYGGFAFLSSTANLASQKVCFWLYSGVGSLMVALVIGTGVGLVSKYLLDKKWIFYDPAQGAKAHGKKFGLYTMMGLFTTVIFWGTEALFHHIFPQEVMTYVGGALGLAMGYVVKYHLDRRFVFTGSGLRAPSAAEDAPAVPGGKTSA